MKLAFSHIAWPVEQDAAVAELLSAHGVTGLEIAPTKVWPRPLEASDAAIEAYRRGWAERGIRIVTAQALLFGRPDLTLFENAETRRATRDYLTGIIRLCGRLGAEALVFGSPKNRRLHGLPPATAHAIAIEFFGELGERAHAAGTHLVLEANPLEYGADFVTRAGDAIALVEAVDLPGFRLHLDTGCMTLAGDDTATAFERGFPLLRHFHVSAPHLGPVGPADGIDHAAFAAQLHARGYAHWLSVEMRQPEPFTLSQLAASLSFVRGAYSM